MTETLYPLIPEGLIDYRPLSDGYAIKMPDPFQRTDMSQGPAKQFRVFRNAPATFTVAWPMTNQEFEIFNGLAEETGGVYAWHSLQVFRGASYETMKVRVVQGTYEPEINGDGWIVRGQLETMSYRPLAGDALSTAILTNGTDLSIDELEAMLAGAWQNVVDGLRNAAGYLHD
jgi:hypothetical protein